MFFWNSSFFHDPADVGNLISGSSAFPKTSWNIWKFTVHVNLRTGYCFCFGFIPSFFLELLLHWSPVAYWTPTNPGSVSFSILSFCLFILFMGFSRQEYWSGLPFPSPVLKPGLENFVHYFTSMWDECTCAVVWAFFGIAFLWDWNESWPFPVL